MFDDTTLSATSKKQYTTKLQQWLAFSASSITDLEADPQYAMETLHAAPIAQTPTNRHLYLSAMVAYVQHIAEDKSRLHEWKKVQMENSEPLREHYGTKEPTERQKDKHIAWPTLEAKRLTLPQGSQERLLLTLYTCMEPVRADYYATALIKEGEDTEEPNYIVLSDPPRLILTDFKTKKRYHTLENQFPPVVAEELKSSLEKHPRSYLFVTETNAPYTRKLFSNWACRALTRILGQPMTLTALRHLYITEKISEALPLEEMKEIAKKMGHSREMQRDYQWMGGTL